MSTSSQWLSYEAIVHYLVPYIPASNTFGSLHEGPLPLGDSVQDTMDTWATPAAVLNSTEH